MTASRCLVLLAVSILGCGPSKTGQSPNSLSGAFQIIENSVDDLRTTIQDPNYKTSGDLGGASDRLGFALASFIKTVEGKPLATDAEQIQKKLGELEQLVTSGADVEKQREAVNALQAAVAAVKAKL